MAHSAHSEHRDSEQTHYTGAVGSLLLGLISTEYNSWPERHKEGMTTALSMFTLSDIIKKICSNCKLQRVPVGMSWDILTPGDT